MEVQIGCTKSVPHCKKIPQPADYLNLNPDERYKEAAAEFGPAILRLARGYENDAEKRRDLVQDIHLALWRSFALFDGRCSLRTWVYRVAHASAASYVARQKRWNTNVFVSIEELETMPVSPDAHKGVALDRLTDLIQKLKTIDRQIILSWLEGMEASEIAEVTGLTARNIATKVHRIKSILARDFNTGDRNG